MTEESIGRSRLMDVYSQGMLMDQKPDIPPIYEELEEAAEEEMPPEVFGFASGSAGSGRTENKNTSAFDDWSIVPRMMRDVSSRDLSTEILGETWNAPLALAPIGVQSIYHEEGEVATAEAASELGLPFVLSTVASKPIEKVSEVMDSNPFWFQLYWSSNRELAASLIQRAEDSDADALVITVDSPIVGWREIDVKHGYIPFLYGEGLGNYFSDPVFREMLNQPPEENEDAAIMKFLDVYGDSSLEWSELSWIKDQTDLPVVVKGVLHPGDAELAVEHGADGVVVSNHGGRQVDNSVPALKALPEVSEAVSDDVALIFDSGIRRGADVLVALALGADAVQVGRPYIYGLAIKGSDGVKEVCENLLADMDLTMGLSGRSSVSEVNRDVVVRSDEDIRTS